MNDKPDPKSAIRQYFNREISLREAVAVLDAYVPAPEAEDSSTKEESSPPAETKHESKESKK